MWICSKCKSEVDDDFEICWKCQTDRQGQGSEFYDERADQLSDEHSREQHGGVAARTFLSVAYVITGALCGAVIGYLMGPTLPGAGHLPLETVLTGGDDLDMAQEAFTIFWASSVIGAIAGFIIGKLRKPYKASSS